MGVFDNLWTFTSGASGSHIKDEWRTYMCAHCSNRVTGLVVARSRNDKQQMSLWLRCPDCQEPSVWIEHLDAIIPGPRFGPSVEGLPSNVEDAYEEARQCMAAQAFTAAELLCRKILMHIAVEKGAAAGEKFAAYLTYLEQTGYITPPMKPWVDLIRKHGNLATHELPPSDRQRAESTVMFTAELLRLVYEMEYLAQRYTPSS